MNSQVIVLSAKRYKVTGEGGELVQGVSVSYLMTDTLKAVTVDSDTFGCIPAKFNAAYEDFDKFKMCPGIYDMNFTMTVVGGIGGKVTLKPESFEFLRPVEIVSEKSKK